MCITNSIDDLKISLHCFYSWSSCFMYMCFFSLIFSYICSPFLFLNYKWVTIFFVFVWCHLRFGNILNLLCFCGFCFVYIYTSYFFEFSLHINDLNCHLFYQARVLRVLRSKSSKNAEKWPKSFPHLAEILYKDKCSGNSVKYISCLLGRPEDWPKWKIG